MNDILQEIVHTIEASADHPGYLDALFGENLTDVQQGRPVVIFGSGGLGKEMQATLAWYGIQATAFCDNDASRHGMMIEGVSVISFDELLHRHKNSIIVIAIANHRAQIAQQLADAGFSDIQIAGTGDQSDFIYMYSMRGTQVMFFNYETECRPESYLAFLTRNQDHIARAHDLFHDNRSKSLLVSKLALMASGRSFDLFQQFISKFSEPYRDFGLTGYSGTPEDHYYFNNDAFKLADGEIYVDIGAYDGDTVETFVQACRKGSVQYRHIFAFEPDPPCFEKLLNTASAYENISCHPLGLWSTSGKLRFSTSDMNSHDQSAQLTPSGNLEIEVTSLDDFLQEGPVTLIKADPGGGIMPQVLQGAANTIRRFSPKLAVGAYHGIGSIFEIPLMVNELCPDYRLTLRHNTHHLCDTDLYAVVTKTD